MLKSDTFESERLFFRGINETDTEHLVKWRLDETVIHYFRNPAPITKEGHLQWYEQSYLKNSERYDFMIIEKDSGQAIGTVGVNRINNDEQSCEISYMIAEPSFQRKGYAKESVTAMMEKMILQEIRRFYAEIHVDNIASIQTVSRLGFTRCEDNQPFLLYRKEFLE